MQTPATNPPQFARLAGLLSLAMLTLTPLSAIAEEDSAEEAIAEEDSAEEDSAEEDSAESDDDRSESGEPTSDEATEAPETPETPEPAPPAAEPEPTLEPAPAAEPAPLPPPPAAKPAPPRVGYEGGFFIASPDGAFELAVNGQIQARFGYEATVGSPRSHEAEFSIPRARLRLGGHAFGERIAFALQLDFGQEGASFKDALMDFHVIDRKLMVEVGQFKRPFSRQQLTSSTDQQFVDRAITDKHFGAGRGLGVMVHNHKSSQLEYAVGLFNGSGGEREWLRDKADWEDDEDGWDNDAGELGFDEDDLGFDRDDLDDDKDWDLPPPIAPTLVARVGWHSDGFDGYSESDPRGSDFGIGIGGGVLVDFGRDIRAGLDYALVARGFSSTGGVTVATAQGGKGFLDPGFGSVGFHVQAGYVIKGKVEPAIRYARIMSAGDAGASQEILVAINVFCHGHNVKWSTDFGVVNYAEGTRRSADFRVRSQVQLAF
jgi:hypothetical protein